MLASMSAKGHCFDNAFMESFFKSLKAEEVYLTEYETREDVESKSSNLPTLSSSELLT
jgi:transposase InsO family protein